MVRRLLERHGKRSIAVSVGWLFLALFGIALAASVDQALLAKFSQLETQWNLPSGILAKVAQIESGGNAKAHAPNGSAAGLFQWTERSWYDATNALYKHHVPAEQRYDPFVSAEVTAFGLAQIRSKIGSLVEQAKLDMTVGLYMGHFLGAGDAKTFLTGLIQTPDSPAASALPKAAAANKARFYSGGRAMSYKEVVNKIAADLKRPGISGVSNYDGTYSGSLSSPRIMTDQALAGVAQEYNGPPPAVDPRFDSYNNYFQEPLPPGSCQQRLFCSGNAVMVRDNACNVSQREACVYGCADGACLNPSQQQSCPDGSQPVYGQCRQQACPNGQPMVGGQCQQQCPVGMMPSPISGQCAPIQQNQLPQSQQPFGSLPSGGSTGSVAPVGGPTGGAVSTNSGASAPQSLSSIGDYLMPKTGEIGNTAAGFSTKSFDLLSTLEATSSLAPAGPGRDVVGFGAADTGRPVDIAGFRPSTAGQAGFSPTGAGQETFTSADLRDLPPVPSSAPSNPGIVNTILSNLKAALLKAYDFLVSLRVKLTQQR